METYRPEKLPQETTTLTPDKLYEQICPDGAFDERFKRYDEGGVFNYFFPSDLSNPFKGKTYYQVSTIGGKVVGLSELEIDPYKENNLWVKFISVDPTYQGQGHAKCLAEEIIRFAKEQGYTLEHSTFFEEGEARIYGLIDTIAKEHGVTVLNPVT